MKQLFSIVILSFITTLYAFSNKIIDLNRNPFTYKSNILTKTQKLKILNAINNIRKKYNLPLFKYDKKLELMALLHANYLYYTGNYVHKEDPSLYPFFGIKPSDRGRFIHYPTNFIGEEFAITSNNIRNGLVGLISTPYHRLGLLSYKYNLLGITSLRKGQIFYTVIEMSNSYIKNLCSTKGKYFYKKTDVCNSSFNLTKKEYDYSLLIPIKKSKTKPFVLYPFNDNNKVNTIFNNESPNSLKNLGNYRNFSGYPITINFNPFLNINPSGVNCILKNERGKDIIII